MTNLISSFFIGIGVVVSSIFSPTPKIQEEPVSVGATDFTFAGTLPFFLSGSGVTASATSIGLTSFTIKQTGTELVTADFPGGIYLTIEPGSPTKQEFTKCTTVTQAAGSAAATLSGCTRGLSAVYPYTADTAQRFSHSGGVTAIISNSPAFYSNFLQAGNDATITGLLTFTTSPIVPVPTTAFQAVNKSYVDGGILAGAATSTESVTGIVRLATALQTASSTASTANTPLVIQAQNATSTYNSATAPLKVVVTQNDGKIDSNFIRQSDNFAWTGTTTISASSVTNNALVLNTIPYSFGSTRSASSTILTEDGNGNLRFQNPEYFYASSSATTLLASADTANTDSHSNSYVKYKEIQVFVNGSYNVSFDCSSNNVNAAQCRIYVNGVARGTEREVTGGSYSTFTEIINCYPGDYVQLYAKYSTASNVYFRNFRIYADILSSTNYTTVKMN